MLSRRALPLALLLLAASLAGCAQTDDGGDDMTTGTTPAGTGATPTTTPSGGSDPTPTIERVLVGTDAAYPPFEDTLSSGEIVGFDVDVMREIANRSGFTVEFQNSGFTAIIPGVQSGTFDVGASAFTINDERKAQIDFSVPYYENRLLVAVAADDTTITSEEDVRGKRVCTQEGTTSQFYLVENLGFAEEDLLLVPTAPQCKDALLRGDVDALMIDAAFVRNVIETSNGELKQAFAPIDADEEFGIVVKKERPELLNAINAALTAMRSDGTLDELADKWSV